MRWMARALFILTLIMATRAAFAGELGAIRDNNEGVKRFEKGRANDAYHKFTEALADLPFDGTVHSNLGDTFLANKEFDKAMSEYREAIRLSPGQSRRDRTVRFHSLFNMALIHSMEKRIDAALETYQMALEIVPDSVETKTNMELLIQSGGGGGQGDDQKDKKPQDGQGDQDQQQPQKFDDKKKEKPKPKPFDSKDLTQQDVNKILDELKQQEEQVRAKMERQGAKDAPPDKDW
jgi:Ca-activated chloride channel homolog